MSVRIFYSWQSDTNKKTNNFFIRNAIREATKNYRDELQLDERPYLDHDTKEVPGSPEIFNTILNKIESCDIFIADLTFVAKSQGGKLVPNPNVMVELGYALKAVGPGRLILVMNEAYGRAGELPFDLQHRRWPIRFNAKLDSEGDELSKTFSDLVGSIRQAIKTIIQNAEAKTSTSSAQVSESDRQLFQSFLNDFPSQGKGARFLRAHDIGGSFPASDLNEIDNFIHTWNDAEHEFNNQKLEEKRQTLWTRLNVFNRELGQHTSMTHRTGWLSIGMNDYEVRAGMNEIREKLNDLATEAYEAHQDLIREARQHL